MKVLLFKTRASFSLFGHSECHQGLTVKTSGLKKSYKSLITTAVLRPSLTNFFSVCTGALEGWPIPNISDTLKRIGDAKPTVFGLIDFTRHHLIKIHEHSLHLYVPLDYSNGLVLPWDLRAPVLISNVVWQV